MRTNIEINENVIREIMELASTRTHRRAIEVALNGYLRYLAKLELLKLRGKVQWDGNLDEMRSH